MSSQRATTVEIDIDVNTPDDPDADSVLVGLNSEAGSIALFVDDSADDSSIRELIADCRREIEWILNNDTDTESGNGGRE